MLEHTEMNPDVFQCFNFLSLFFLTSMIVQLDNWMKNDTFIFASMHQSMSKWIDNSNYIMRLIRNLEKQIKK